MKEIWPGVEVPNAFARGLGIVDGEFTKVIPGSSQELPSNFLPSKGRQNFIGKSPVKTALRALQALALLAGSNFVGPTVASADSSLPIQDPQYCSIVLGFNEELSLLRQYVPYDQVICVDSNEKHSANGDATQSILLRVNGKMQQHLAVWRKADNWTADTDGYRTWVNGPNGLQERLNSQRFSWEANPDNLPLADSNSSSIPISTPQATPDATPTPTPGLMSRDRELIHANNIEFMNMDANEQSIMQAAIQEAIQKAPRNVDPAYRNGYLAQTYSSIPYNAILDDLNNYDFIDALGTVDYITAQSGDFASTWSEILPQGRGPLDSNGWHGWMRINPQYFDQVPGYSKDATNLSRVAATIKEPLAILIYWIAIKHGVTAPDLFAENTSERIAWLYFIGNDGNLSSSERSILEPFYKHNSETPCGIAHC